MTTIEMLLKMFPDGGYFVEAGAHDGVGDSQTKVLEDVGWNGICVEPSSAFDGLKRNRKCNTDSRCLDATNGWSIFREVRGEAVELSGLLAYFNDCWDRETRPHIDRLMQCVTLPTLLLQHGAPSIIEFLCLDTEGSELAILTVHNFARYRFQVIEVEHNGVASRKVELRQLLESHGYANISDDGINALYLERRDDFSPVS